MEPVVHLRDAVALLGRFPALAGIDLEVRRASLEDAYLELTEDSVEYRTKETAR